MSYYSTVILIVTYVTLYDKGVLSVLVYVIQFVTSVTIVSISYLRNINHLNKTMYGFLKT
jgi:hypothetical protein